MTYETESQYGNMLKAIIADFKKIPDSRVLGRAKYRIPAVLTLALLALVAGRRTWNSFQAYGEAFQEHIKEMVPLFTSVPSEDAFSRIIGGINPRHLHDILFKRGKTFAVFANGNKPGRRPGNAPPYQVVLDGKTVTGAVMPGAVSSKIHIVNAVSEKMVFLGSQGVEKKSNEIPVYPTLIRSLYKALDPQAGGLALHRRHGMPSRGCQGGFRTGPPFPSQLEGQPVENVRGGPVAL